MIKKVVDRNKGKTKLIFQPHRGPDKILDNRGCFVLLTKERFELLANYDWHCSWTQRDDTTQFHLVVQKPNLSICRTLYTIDGDPEPGTLWHCIQIYYPGGETWIYGTKDDCNELFDIIKFWLNNDKH